MKKVLAVIVLVALGLGSCKKEEEVTPIKIEKAVQGLKDDMGAMD